MIEPKKLIDYAMDQGWELLTIGEKDGLHVLTNPAFPGRMLTFPIATDAPDYDEAVMLLAKKLASLSGLEVNEILREVSRCVG